MYENNSLGNLMDDDNVLFSLGGFEEMALDDTIYPRQFYDSLDLPLDGLFPQQEVSPLPLYGQLQHVDSLDSSLTSTLNSNPSDVTPLVEPVHSQSSLDILSGDSKEEESNVDKVNVVDNDEYTPDSEEMVVTMVKPKKPKKLCSRTRGHNLNKDMRFRVGQLMIGFQNRFPRKTKKEIASLITKRLAQEYP